MPARQVARRCVVKVSYARNKKLGTWAAHGSYLVREGAQKEGELTEAFGKESEGMSVRAELNRWQSEGDPRLFKVVLSPEDGDRLDMRSFTRENMQRLETHIGRELEWVDVEHYNT
jgi:type IV secretory pathway VirD2 relaxase